MHIRFSPTALVKALQVVAPFASKDTTRPHLNCIRVELLTDGKVAFVATDGRRLVVYSITPEVVSAKRATTVSYDLRNVAPLLAMLKPHCKPSKTPVTVDIKTVAGTASVCGVGLEVLSQTTLRPSSAGDRFPPFRKVLPAKSGTLYPAEIQAKFAMSAYAAFERAGSNARLTGVCAYQDGELGPVVFLSPVVPELVVMTMPMRSTGVVRWPAIADVAVEAPAKAKKAVA